jgi:acetyl-CoA carboxylase carboxyltransferase component
MAIINRPSFYSRGFPTTMLGLAQEIIADLEEMSARNKAIVVEAKRRYIEARHLPRKQKKRVRKEALLDIAIFSSLI